jgi:hypothetical protein
LYDSATAGAVTVIVVLDIMFRFDAVTPPNVTLVVPLNPVPVSVTVYPPLVWPWVGERETRDAISFYVVLRMILPTGVPPGTGSVGDSTRITGAASAFVSVV